MFGFIRERIYLQVLLLFAAGIAIGGLQIMPHGLPSIILWPSIGLIACLLAIHFLWHPTRHPLARLPVSLAIACSGFLYTNIAIHQVTDAAILQYADSGQLDGTAIVRSLPKYQRGHLRFIAEITGIEDEQSQQASLGRCQFYLRCEPGFVLSPGDRLEFSAELEEVAPPRNRGQFNYRAYLLQRGTILTCYLPSPQFMEVLDDSGSRRLAWLTVLRGHLMESLTADLPEDLQDLSVSVVYGDKITDLDEQLQERFRRAGLTHILVASGTQVSLLILLMAMMLWRSPRSFDGRGTLISIIQFVVTIAVVATYAGITGYETSIVRALCMGILLCAGRLFLRNVDGLSTLSQAGLILLLAQPLQLFTPGFQLSFLATFGLIYMMGTLHPLIAHIEGWRRFLLDGLLTTGGAQLFVTPVLAYSFNQFSLVGLLSNLLAVPLSLVLLVCGALSSFGLATLPLIGPVLNWLVMIFAGMLNGLAIIFGDLPFSSIAVPSPPAWFIACFYLLALLFGEWYRNRDSLQADQLRLLQPATLLLGWLVGGWIAMRMILPHPELSLLKLERSFAIYLDDPGHGRHLIVNPHWLSRRHNADNLLSSLKARGVSRVDSVGWLGEPPDDNPLDELSSMQFELAEAVGGMQPYELLNDRTGEICGMLCRLAGDDVAVCWKLPEDGLSALQGDGLEPELILLLSSGNMPIEQSGLPMLKGDEASGLCIYSADEVRGEGSDGWICSDAEIRIEPAPQDRLCLITIRR